MKALLQSFFWGNVIIIAEVLKWLASAKLAQSWGWFKGVIK